MGVMNMSEYFIYYSASNIVSCIVFGIMLAHDRLSIDKQEKQLKYDDALIAFMLYFLSDAIWSGVDSGVFPVNRFTVLTTNFINFIILFHIVFYKFYYYDCNYIKVADVCNGSGTDSN